MHLQNGSFRQIDLSIAWIKVWVFAPLPYMKGKLRLAVFCKDFYFKVITRPLTIQYSESSDIFTAFASGSSLSSPPPPALTKMMVNIKMKRGARTGSFPRMLVSAHGKPICLHLREDESRPGHFSC